MCQPSKIADDWVKKGCHIHVEGVELTINPNHKGGIVFQSYFSTVPAGVVANAIKTAEEECLPDKEVRDRWLRDLRRATLYLLTYEGAYPTKANGRMAEFKFLRIALER